MSVKIRMILRQVRINNVLMPAFWNDLFSIEPSFPGRVPSDPSYTPMSKKKRGLIGFRIIKNWRSHMEAQLNDRRLPGQVNIEHQTPARSLVSCEWNWPSR